MFERKEEIWGLMIALITHHHVAFTLESILHVYYFVYCAHVTQCPLGETQGMKYLINHYKLYICSMTERIILVIIDSLVPPISYVHIAHMG